MSQGRKKVLILIDWFEPAYKAGGQIQSCRNIVMRLQDNCDFYILTSDRDIGDAQPFKGVATEQWLPYGTHARVYYLKASELTTGRLKKIMNDVKPDVVYLNSMYSYRFTLLPLTHLASCDVQIVLAPSGMLQEGALQFGKLKKQLFLALFRLSGIQRKILFHATDETEAQDICTHISKNARIIVAQCLPASIHTELRPADKNVNELRVVYLSRITPKKNL
ncbi:MAG TPA: hypothetical protein VEB42_11215, partial [Chitinophagaceae bacterium]|nr:hypothetical protein [Chitinophagaceae bacterium]